MRAHGNVIALAFGLIALIWATSGQIAQAQQSNATAYNDTYASALAKAREECNALWSDHVFDPIRSKIPLGEVKPTFSMLKNTEKLKPKDRPLADLAIKTVEKCRSAFAPVFAMLPEQANALMQGLMRKQDALIARLYNGKITFGDYNVGIDQMLGEFVEVISGIRSSSQSSTAAAQTPKVEQQKLPPPQSRTATLDQPNRPAIQFHDVRIALVIGNSNYTNLPKLSNPTNDARAIAEILQKLGYQTQLLLDASDQSIRNEVRKFASESNKAGVAVVYYAGHGAQLNGNNYLLPIDIDIPRTEADIQFAGLKVDDLVNSIGSNTKIVFLDACRDNPALFKNIVKGRGSAPIGLAPAAASNFSPGTPGGGVFIAYATDAGAIADDGRGQHSPFTQALLRNMQKPISIDDMFSLVTREVRLVTKNAQRPYKYASLENIVCLTPACSSTPTPIDADISQQAKQSETDDLQVALQTNNADALQGYLQKYSDTTKRDEILRKIEDIKRSEFTEWTLYEIVNLHFPQFMQLSSIRQFGDRASAKVKQLIDQSVPGLASGQMVPGADYTEDVDVYDCNKPLLAISEESVFSSSGTLLSHYKWADPQYLNLSIGTPLPDGAAGLTAKYIACHGGAPMISKKQIAEMKFNSLSSTVSGDGEIFYELGQDQDGQNTKQIITIIKNFADHNIADFLPSGMSIPNPASYRSEVDHILLRCGENKMAIDRTELWNASNELVRIAYAVPAKFSDFNPRSPFAYLQMIACGKGYTGLGIRITQDNGAIKVAEVFDRSPAQQVGIKANDIITHVDNASVNGMTLDELIERIRGVADSQITLTIVREGHSDPLKLTVTRENIQMQSKQTGIAK